MNNNIRELTCSCGNTINIDDVIDSYMEGTNTYVNICVGICSQCGKQYIYNEYYQFTHISNVREFR